MSWLASPWSVIIAGCVVAYLVGRGRAELGKPTQASAGALWGGLAVGVIYCAVSLHSGAIGVHSSVPTTLAELIGTIFGTGIVGWIAALPFAFLGRYFGRKSRIAKRSFAVAENDYHLERHKNEVGPR